MVYLMLSDHDNIEVKDRAFVYFINDNWSFDWYHENLVVGGCIYFGCF